MCGIEEHKFHKTDSLRPIVIGMMEKFENDFKNFEQWFNKIFCWVVCRQI